MIAGRLRHRVNIEQPTEGAHDSYSETTDTWAVWQRNVPAAVDVLSGNEAVRAAQVHPDATVQVTTRYRDGCDTAQRLVYGSRTLYPVALIEDPRHTSLIWMCREEQ